MIPDPSRPDAPEAPSVEKPSLLGRVGASIRRAVTGVAPGGAFGAPGAEARWTRAAKQGVGTAYHTSCLVWFTVADGIVNEVYYPLIDRPNTRDLQFLITDGATFCHEERRDLDHQLEYPEKDALLYRLTNTDRAGRYRIVKEVICDAEHSVLLIHAQVEILDESLRGKLRVFALLAPHLNRGGMHNSAALCNLGGRKLFHAFRADTGHESPFDDVHLAFGAQPDFLRRSVGYAGASDGWQDLRNFAMDWEFPSAEDGNIALTAECDLSRGGAFTLAVGFGRLQFGAATKVIQAFSLPFARHRRDYVAGWQGVSQGPDHAKHTGDGGSLFRLSRCLLQAHEDKVFCGAIVASLSIPWGETKGDAEIGGYHLVWPRDLVQTCTGLLAAGHTDAPRRALGWLACLQGSDGGLPQNAWIQGEAHLEVSQLDQVAAPVLLAWRVREAKALAEFDPWTLVSRAAGCLVARGPVTMQERWEEASGWSPSTLAASIAALVITGVLARERGDAATAGFVLAYADWLEAHLEEWTVTTRGELMAGAPRHYIRLTPADASDPHAKAEPDTAVLKLANGGGEWPARNVVSLDFLQLVRLGVRDPLDPLVIDSLGLAEAILRHDFPGGPCWMRYNHDGYGQKADGSAFDGAGAGGSWPLLTGERGHYELAAGRDPRPYIQAMERLANAGGMLPEQVWCGDDLPGLKRGDPTGSAMPLCWAHAEYMTLVRGAADGAAFDRIEPVYDRYVRRRAELPPCRHEMWSCAHRVASMPAGRTLRVITPGAAVVHWGVADEAGGDVTAQETGLGCWFADLPTAALPAGAEVRFRLICDGNSGDEEHCVAVSARPSALG